MSQVLIAVRVVLAVVFLRSGYLKARSPDAFRRMVRALTFLSGRQRQWISAGLPIVEMVLGAWLLSGLLATAATATVLFALLVMTLSTTWFAGAVTTGISCGCATGGADTSAGPALIARNLVLLAVAAVPLVIAVWAPAASPGWQQIGSDVGWQQGALIVLALVGLTGCCVRLAEALGEILGGSNDVHRHPVGLERVR